MIIEISVAVIALAFVILVIYLIVITKALAVTLGQVNLTLVEARKVVEEAHMSAADLNRKLETLDPLFQSVENVGEILENESFALKERKCVCRIKVEEDELNVSDFVVLADLGVRLWNKFNKRSKS